MTRMRVLLLSLLTVLLTSGSGGRVEERPLPFFYDLYSFRGAGGGTAVVAAFAVPAGSLEAEREGDGVRYRFDVSLVLADTALRTVSRTDDSVFVELGDALPPDHLLYTHIEVESAPSSSTLHRVIVTDATAPGIGQLYVDDFRIPDYSGDELMLSDVVLGQPDAEAGWRRGGVALALLPTSQFPASAFDVYYEIYNLPERRPYRTEVTVEPMGSGLSAGEERRKTVRFFAESASRRDGTLPELRRVEASLERGRYRITVTVTDQETGRSASRSREFEVRGTTRDVTMVPALPHDAYPGTGSGRLPRGRQ